jgi:hypothetical protein
VLRKVLVLPVTFFGGVGGDGSGGGGRDSIGGSVPGVTGNVGGCGGVTRSTGGSASRAVIGVTGGGVGGKCGGAHVAKLNLTTHPGTSSLDSFPRSVVARVLLFEVGEDVLGAVSSPEHQ